MVITPASVFFGILAAAAVVGSAVLFGKWQTLRRAEYIRTFK